ncbi:MAG: adenylosuccinate synthetase [Candidatus Cloacimonetes bacterium]|jgi:adenylosuccinate synthase|nr:adenylosuccinate synthetase [Candidatus Cloacimonadota bacterium]
MKAVITVGLGFGDEGKGASVDYLCRELKADLVVRYSGGCQAAHNVMLPSGVSHTFSQFGSGTFHHIPTYLGPDVIVSPLFMRNEANHLIQLGYRPYKLLKVDKECLITTPYHQSLNRFQESKRGDGRHGSCGMGIGATREYSLLYPEYALRMKDLRPHHNRLATVYKLQKIKQWVNETAGVGITNYMDADHIYDHLNDTSKGINVVDGIPDFEMAVFEGAQGVLLDENHGYHPHTTWSTVNTERAWELLQNSDTKVHVMGCTRPYMTRHGAGTFLSYDEGLSHRLSAIADAENPKNEWQGHIRYGLLDLNVLAYSKAALGSKLHSISMSCVDHIGDSIPIIDTAEDAVETDQAELGRRIEQVLAPISVIGTGKSYADRSMTKLSWHNLKDTIEE